MSSRYNNSDGDWICSDSKCRNLNFARRSNCNRCGKRKEVHSDSHKKKQGIEIGKVAAEKSHGLFSAEDWQCSKCGNVNWARRQTCNMCNAPKVGEVEERTGYGGGFNEREGVEYIQREESDDEFDEFGRRKKKFRGANPKPEVSKVSKISPPNDEEKEKKKTTDGDEEEEEDDDDDEEDEEDLSKYDLWQEEEEEEAESEKRNDESKDKSSSADRERNSNSSYTKYDSGSGSSSPESSRSSAISSKSRSRGAKDSSPSERNYRRPSMSSRDRSRSRDRGRSKYYDSRSSLSRSRSRSNSRSRSRSTSQSKNRYRR